MAQSTGFDFQGALKEGNSPQDIFDYLQDKNRQDEAISYFAKNRTPGDESFMGSQSSNIIGGQKVPQNRGFFEKLAEGAQQIGEQAPAIGAGTIAGIVTGGNPFAVGGAMATGQGLTNIAKQIGGYGISLNPTEIGETGVLGGLTEGAFKLGGLGGKILQSGAKKGAETLAGSVVGGATKKDVEEQLLQEARNVNLKKAGKIVDSQTPEQFYLQEGPGIKTGEGLLVHADNVLTETGKALDKVVTSPIAQKVKIPFGDVPKIFDEAIRQANNIGNTEKADLLKEMQAKYVAKGDTITLQESNQLKKDIYRELGDRAYHGNPKLDATKSVLKDIASNLADKENTLLPGMADLNNTYSKWSDIQDNVLTRLARKDTLKQGIRLGSELTGIGTLLATQGLGPALAGAATVGAERAFTSIPGRLAGATLLQKLSQLSIPPAIKEASRAGIRTLGLQFLNRNDEKK